LHETRVRLLEAGVPPSQNPAADVVAWFEKAAAAGSLDGKKALSDHLARGDGVPKNPARAFSLMKEAADAGDAEALNVVGVWYGSGFAVAVNYPAALDYLRKAEAKGFGRAKANLGLYYEGGYGVPANPATAFQYYKAAADLNDSFGQYHLGLAYEKGIGTPVNARLAILCLTRAADAGVPGARIELTRLSAGNGSGARGNATAAAFVPQPVGKGIGPAITVYFYGEFYGKGLQSKPSIFLDGTELARLRNGGWLATRTYVGKHRFCTTDLRDDNCRNISLKANRAYELEVSGLENKSAHYSLVAAPLYPKTIQSRSAIDIDLITTPSAVFFPTAN
jgi:TPR repeat protein